LFCETWSAASREEYRIRVIENRVLRSFFVDVRGRSNRRLKKTAQKGAS
jgi:hypothetical protein